MPGDDVAVVPGTENHEPGDVRVSFLVVDAEGAVVALPTARVWVADALDAPPFLEERGEARAHRHSRWRRGGRDAHLRREPPADAARQVLAARRARGRRGEGAGARERRRQSPRTTRRTSVTQAIASQTPTLSSTGGDTSSLTTRTPPDETLLRHSVAESLAAKVPFVVTFATPKFCSSRTCGPVVDVVEEVSRRFEGENVRFIHVEVFEDNDPAKGFNRWLRGVEASDRAVDVPRRRRRQDRRALRGNGLRERARGRGPRAAARRLVGGEAALALVRVADALDHDVRHARDRAEREHRAHERDDVVGRDLLVLRQARSTRSCAWPRIPGEIAVARTPFGPSSRFSEVVHAMSAAFVAP